MERPAEEFLQKRCLLPPETIGGSDALREVKNHERETGEEEKIPLLVAAAVAAAVGRFFLFSSSKGGGGDGGGGIEGGGKAAADAVWGCWGSSGGCGIDCGGDRFGIEGGGVAAR